MSSKYCFIIYEYHKPKEIIFQSDYVWSEDQAYDLKRMFEALNGETYNSFVVREGDELPT